MRGTKREGKYRSGHRITAALRSEYHPLKPWDGIKTNARALSVKHKIIPNQATLIHLCSLVVLLLWPSRLEIIATCRMGVGGGGAQCAHLLFGDVILFVSSFRSACSSSSSSSPPPLSAAFSMLFLFHKCGRYYKSPESMVFQFLASLWYGYSFRLDSLTFFCVHINNSARLVLQSLPLSLFMLLLPVLFCLVLSSFFLCGCVCLRIVFRIVCENDGLEICQMSNQHRCSHKQRARASS